MKHHQLSEFLCREMLYDFATGHLDSARQEAIQEGLQEHPELEIEFQALRQGMAYTKKLSQTQIKPHIIQAILLKKSFFHKGLARWQMPYWMWIAIGGVLLGGALLFGIFSLKKWMKKPSHNVLWSIDNIKHPSVNSDSKERGLEFAPEQNHKNKGNKTNGQQTGTTQ